MGMLNDFSRFDLYSDESLLFIVDEQEKLLQVMENGEKVLANTRLLLQACKELSVPVIKSEQYPKGLGKTHPDIEALCQQTGMDYKNYEKLEFSALSNDVKTTLRLSGRSRVIVVGVESHICVMQTVRALLKHGYFVYLVLDAISARKEENTALAVEQMREMGAVITCTEAVIYDWLKQAGTSAFKNLSKLLK